MTDHCCETGRRSVPYWLTRAGLLALLVLPMTATIAAGDVWPVETLAEFRVAGQNANPGDEIVVKLNVDGSGSVIPYTDWLYVVVNRSDITIRGEELLEYPDAKVTFAGEFTLRLTDADDITTNSMS